MKISEVQNRKSRRFGFAGVCGVKDSEIFNENGATFFQSAKDKEGLETQPANQRSFGILCVWGFQMKKMRE